MDRLSESMKIEGFESAHMVRDMVKQGGHGRQYNWMSLPSGDD